MSRPTEEDCALLEMGEDVKVFSVDSEVSSPHWAGRMGTTRLLSHRQREKTPRHQTCRFVSSVVLESTTQ